MAVAEFVVGCVGVDPEVGEGWLAEGSEEAGEGVNLDAVESGCDVGDEIGLSEGGGVVDKVIGVVDGVLMVPVRSAVKAQVPIRARRRDATRNGRGGAIVRAESAQRVRRIGGACSPTARPQDLRRLHGSTDGKPGSRCLIGGAVSTGAAGPGQRPSTPTPRGAARSDRKVPATTQPEPDRCMSRRAGYRRRLQGGPPDAIR